jgi:hypothetical protein
MHARLLARTLSAVALILGFALAPSNARAQCGPDGLDGGPCCQPAGVALPDLPRGEPERCGGSASTTCQSAFATTYCGHLGAPLPLTGGGAFVAAPTRSAST